jgi:tRNA (guanine37-N1)-methyltransferase
MESVIGSFDIIGDIAIIEIPETLSKHETRIGEALLGVHKNLKTILKKLGPMEGEFRVRKVKCIAGEDKTVTLYRESGVAMELDVAKVYFSVRLSHERKRIAELVKPGERILALFAGVGPFPLVIARKEPSARIVAVELNPDAVAFMRKNVERNRAGNVEVVLGDAREAVLRNYRAFADRVLMPLPKGAYDFLDVAFAGAKDGAIIHFYTFADVKEPFVESIAKAECAAEKSGVGIDVVAKRIVRPYSPQTVQVVLDMRVRKMKEKEPG